MNSGSHSGGSIRGDHRQEGALANEGRAGYEGARARRAAGQEGARARGTHNGAMTHDAAARVRAFLLASDFTTDGVLARVGAEAFAALGRDLAVPVRRALAASGARRPDPSTPGTHDGSELPSQDQSGSRTLDRLIEAFLLADPIAADALPPEVADDLEVLGMVRREGDRLVPLVDVRPYGEPDTDWYVVSDIGAPATPDHVLGLGGASLTLARITPRRDVGRAMDLGCGAGSQVLHAARHASRVVATDTNPRALTLTALTAALSGIPEEQVDLREGSMFAPVSDERFDLVVSNPPFVISPSHRFTYRDAGLPGDELSRLVVRGAAAHLAPGGMAAVLGNWLHVEGEDWRERVAEWVSGTGVAAWIVERDTQSVADYAATWLRDAQVPEGPEFDAAMNEWLDAFADEGCVEVGFGWFILVAPGDAGATWSFPGRPALGPRRGPRPHRAAAPRRRGPRLPRGVRDRRAPHRPGPPGGPGAPGRGGHDHRHDPPHGGLAHRCPAPPRAGRSGGPGRLATSHHRPQAAALRTARRPRHAHR